MGMHFVEDPYDHFMESFATPKNTTSPDLPKKQLASAALKLRGLLDGEKEEPMYAPLVIVVSLPCLNAAHSCYIVRILQ